MAWKQLHDADMTVGYTGGWCLKYVQDAFGTDHPYPTAIDAWNANYGGGNHPDELPPLGVTVPIYLSLGNVPAGHVAIRLDDGWVSSSTQPGTHSAPYYHKSIDDLVAVYGQYNGGATYLGWSEYVGTEQVVEFVPDVVTATDDQINQAYQDLLGRTADDGGLAHYRAYTIDFVRQDILNSDEYRTRQEALQPTANPVIAPIHNPDPTPPVTEPIVVPPVDPTPPVETPIVPKEETVTTVPSEPTQPFIETAVPPTNTIITAKPSWLMQLIFLLLKLLKMKK